MRCRTYLYELWCHSHVGYGWESPLPRRTEECELDAVSVACNETQLMGTIMNSADLDFLDSTVAGIEGLPIATLNSAGAAIRPDQSPYRPSRDPDEILRLINKYIDRVVRLNDGWVAVGKSGRACSAATLPIAVCMAIIEAR